MNGRTWLAGVASAAIVIAGCAATTPAERVGTDGSSAIPDNATLAVDDPTSAALAVGLPLDWFVQLREDASQPEAALYFGYMERCMADAGFLWETPESLPIPPEWVEITRYPVRYGMVTVIQAERAAYRDPEVVILGVSTEEADDEGLPTDPAELEAFQTAWFGAAEESVIPENLVIITDPISGEELAAYDPSPPNGGGCQGRANAWLAGISPQVDDTDVTTNPSIAQHWIATQIRLAFDEALRDDRVVTVADQWRVCMTQHGWDLPKSTFPGGLVMFDSGLELGVAKFSDEELAAELERREKEVANTELAVDDVTCQENLGWLTSLRAVEAEYQQQTVERVPELFAQVRAKLEAYGARLATLRLEDLDG